MVREAAEKEPEDEVAVRPLGEGRSEPVDNEEADMGGVAMAASMVVPEAVRPMGSFPLLVTATG